MAVWDSVPRSIRRAIGGGQTYLTRQPDESRLLKIRSGWLKRIIGYRRSWFFGNV